MKANKFLGILLVFLCSFAIVSCDDGYNRYREYNLITTIFNIRTKGI